MRGYDAWVTREPDYGPDEPALLHCSECGGFLKLTPDSSETKEDRRSCNGRPVSFECTYTEQDAAILDIIGWDFLGKTYFAEYDAPCGRSKSHPMHTFVQHAWGEDTHICKRCGHKNVIVNA